MKQVQIEKLKNDILLLLNDGLMEGTVDNELDFKQMSELYAKMSVAIAIYFEELGLQGGLEI